MKKIRSKAAMANVLAKLRLLSCCSNVCQFSNKTDIKCLPIQQQKRHQISVVVATKLTLNVLSKWQQNQHQVFISVVTKQSI